MYIQLGWMLCSCKPTLAVFHALLFVSRNGWTTVCYLLGMVTRASRFSGLATSHIGPSRIHGDQNGGKMVIIAFVAVMVCVAWILWSPQLWPVLEHPSSFWDLRLAIIHNICTSFFLWSSFMHVSTTFLLSVYIS